MKKTSVTFVLALALVFTGACSKKADEQTAQNQAPPAAAQTPAAPAEDANKVPSADGEMPPEAASPNELPAQVSLTDGSKYTGTLVSKNGTQLTFRGENGATRTFDSRDIKSIRFGEPNEAAARATADAASKPASRAARHKAPAEAPKEQAQSAPAPAPTPVPSAESPSTPPAPVRREIVIPSGTQISVRTNESIDSKTASAGQTFSAELTRPVVDESGDVAIPRGAGAALVVRQAGAGKIHANELVLDMQSVTVDGKTYEVETADVTQKGKEGVGGNKRTAKYLGGGAALGAIIGAIAGGGKGAAIGAASGAGAGAGTQILTRGSVKVPAETILTFQLTAPLRLETR